MPTFEQEDKKAALAAQEAAAQQEFRPRRRDGMNRSSLSETVDPAPIPPEVKKQISERIAGMVRQSRGPDETIFTVREFFSDLWAFIRGLPGAVADLFRRGEPEEDDEEDEEDGDEAGEGSSPEARDENAPRQRDPQKPREGRQGKPQQDNGKSRNQRGGRGRGNRRGRGRGRTGGNGGGGRED
jgi:hypothetical protein